MRSRVRYGLTAAGAVLILLGFAAIAASVMNIFTGVADSFGDIDSYDPPGRLAVALTTLLPVGGAVAIVLGVVCIVGAVASLVATEAVDRATLQRAVRATDDEHLSTAETLES